MFKARANPATLRRIIVIKTYFLFSFVWFIYNPGSNHHTESLKHVLSFLFLGCCYIGCCYIGCYKLLYKKIFNDLASLYIIYLTLNTIHEYNKNIAHE